MGIFVDYYNSACGQLEEVDRSEWRDVYGWLDQEHAARAVAAVVGEGEQEQQQQGEEDEEGGQEAFRMHMRRMDRRHALGPRCLLHHLVRSLSAGDVFEGDAPPPCPAPHPALLRAAGLARPRTSLEGGAACAAAAPAGPEQAAPWRGGAACEWCGEEGEELVRCGRCRDAWYCNKVSVGRQGGAPPGCASRASPPLLSLVSCACAGVPGGALEGRPQAALPAASGGVAAAWDCFSAVGVAGPARGAGWPCKEGRAAREERPRDSKRRQFAMEASATGVVDS